MELIKAFLLDYLNTEIQTATPEDANILARLIAYIQIHL